MKSLRMFRAPYLVLDEDIKQVVNVLPSDAEKMPWLLEKLPGMIDDRHVVVIATKKARVDEIEKELNQRGFKIAALHGDKDQVSSNSITNCNSF
jgi:ATP-dependent RNA helicase DDX42